jgi:hypothetical protein
VCNVAQLKSDAASERLTRLLSEVAALRARLGVLEGLVIRRGLAPEASALLLRQQEQQPELQRGAGGRAAAERAAAERAREGLREAVEALPQRTELVGGQVQVVQGA